MKIAAIALLTSLVAMPATAQTTPPAVPGAATRMPSPPAVGASVVDTAGAAVGTIESITGDLAVINTGTNKVGYPLASMTAGPNGPIIAMTKVQLDASFVEQQAKAKTDLAAKLVAGTQVFASDGTTQLGTIKAADAQFVTVTAASGDVRLPVNGFASGATGVVVGLSAADFAKATGGK